jgi:hypothetical protein
MKRVLVTALTLCLLTLGAGAGLTSAASGDQSGQQDKASAAPALTYILHHEQSDGGFPLQPGQKSSTMATAWAAMAIAAARHSGLLPSGDDAGTETITYLERTVKQETGAGAIERTVLALRALGQSVTDVNGVNLLGHVEHAIGSNGSVQNKTNLTTWAILALRSADAAIPAKATRWLEHQQDGDGGFNFATGSRSGTSDPDDTGAALEALAAAGAIGSHKREVSRAIAFLHRDQNRDGGFGSPVGSTSNTESTAWAAQGLIAAGVRLSGFHRRHGRTPIHYLGAMTRSSGEIAYSHGVYETPVWTTAEVLPSLLGEAYPIDVSAHRPKRSKHPHQAPKAGQPLAGTGGALTHVQPNVPLSVGRLIVALHSPL